MNFKEWFYKEAMTSTGAIASFARPVIPGHVRRGQMPMFDELDDDQDEIERRRKKPYMQPQVKD